MPQTSKRKMSSNGQQPVCSDQQDEEAEARKYSSQANMLPFALVQKCMTPGDGIKLFNYCLSLMTEIKLAGRSTSAPVPVLDNIEKQADSLFKMSDSEDVQRTGTITRHGVITVMKGDPVLLSKVKAEPVNK